MTQPLAPPSEKDLNPCCVCNVPAKLGNSNFSNPFKQVGQHTNGPNRTVVGCPNCLARVGEWDMVEYANSLKRRQWVFDEWNRRNPKGENQ